MEREANRLVIPIVRLPGKELSAMVEGRVHQVSCIFLVSIICNFSCQANLLVFVVCFF